MTTKGIKRTLAKLPNKLPAPTPAQAKLLKKLYGTKEEPTVIHQHNCGYLRAKRAARGTKAADIPRILCICPKGFNSFWMQPSFHTTLPGYQAIKDDLEVAMGDRNYRCIMKIPVPPEARCAVYIGPPDGILTYGRTGKARPYSPLVPGMLSVDWFEFYLDTDENLLGYRFVEPDHLYFGPTAP